MRAKVSIKKVSKGVLPFDYQYALASMLYGKLAEGNIRLANESHSHQGFKHYNFSNLILDQYTSTKKGLLFEEALFYISSPDSEFVRSYTEGLLQKPDFSLYDQKFLVSSIEILKKTNLNGKKWFTSLSPIFVKTKREKKGELVEWDLYPGDGKFYDNVHRNLIERYKEFYSYLPEKDVFEITKLKKFKQKRVRIGNEKQTTFRRCSLMTFHMQASEELKKFAYDAGLGEKNAMGFGCIEVL